MSSKKFKKSGAYIYSEETTLVRKSKEDGSIIGRMEDSTFVPFDKKTLELCKKHNNKYDADLAKQFEEPEEEEQQEEDEQQEEEKEEGSGEEDEQEEEVKEPVKKEVAKPTVKAVANTGSVDEIMNSLQTFVNNLVSRNQELEKQLKEREKELKASNEKMATLKKLFS